MAHANIYSKSTPELHELLISLSKDTGNPRLVLTLNNPYTGKPWMERVYLTDNTLYEIWIDTETGNVQWNREDFSYMEKIQ